MAAGDAVGLVQSRAASEYMLVQPGSGSEYCIHNIVHAANCELYLTDGTNDVLFDTGSGNGGWIGQTFFVTYSRYLKVKNISAGAALFGYTGVQTK